MFWYHRDYVGLSEQYFPHVDLDADFLSALMAGDKIERFLSEDVRTPSAAGGEGGGEERRTATVYEVIRVMIETQCLVSKKLLLACNLIPYETNNEFMHRAVEADQMNRRVNQECPAHSSDTMDKVQELIQRYGQRNWRSRMDDELRERVRQVERFNEIRNKSQQACLKVFQSLWLLDGDVDSLTIPDTIKVLLTWYRNNQATKLPHMTREFHMFDPDLSMFGNSMLRKLKMYACVAMILQPLVCMLAEGLFSCYHYAPRTLMFNMMLHGRYDVGKTFTGISTFTEYTSIKGTVRPYTNATEAADTTLRHNYDVIAACDETPRWKTSVAAAEKEPKRVDKEKVKMTDNQLGTEVYCVEKDAAGAEHRWTKTITTDHYMTRIEITNAVVESMNALASRYFRMTVAQPRMPARKMTTKAGDALKEQTKTYMHINQYLTAWICKAEMCGVILPDVEMQLFADVSNRAMDYLVEHQVIPKNAGPRGLEIMKPYARQLVYNMAIHYTFDLPSSPCYKKKFDVSMIHLLQPYLYITTDIIWWCWTALAGCWFDENISNVANAMRRAAGIAKDQWKPTTTTYELFERDVSGKQIRWKMIDGTRDIDGYQKGDEKLIDITYLSLHGKNFEAICGSIASFTSPPLAPTDVMGIINILKQLQIQVEHGFIPQPYGRFRHWHAFLEKPEPSTGFAGRKRIVGPGDDSMPHEYTQREVNTAVPRTIEDVPRYDTTRSCCAMEVHANVIYFMPNIDECFKTEKIVEALEYATLCKSTRPGKVLLGFPEEKDTTQLQVYNLTQDVINAHIQRYDEAEGLKIHGETGKPVWTGDQSIPERERPLSRMEGIVFDRRGGMTNMDAKFFNTVSLAPVKETDEQKWKHKVNEDIKRMNDVDVVCHDLNYESAKRQHIACGRPLDEPVACPKYIEEQYKIACAAQGRPWHSGLDYPHDLLVEMDQRETVWEQRTSASKQAVLGTLHYKEAREDSNRARNPEVRKQIARLKDKQKGTKRELTSMLSSSNTSIDLLGQDETRGENFNEVIGAEAAQDLRVQKILKVAQSFDPSDELVLE